MIVLFNLHEVILRDDSTLLVIESFGFVGCKWKGWFLNVVQPFSEREDLNILGPNSSFAMGCNGYVKLNWIEV